MITAGVGSDRRLYRDADRAVLGGVCAGLAGYLGFNLKVTRFLAVIAFLMAMPIAIIGYMAAVFLIPSESGHAPGEVRKSGFCKRRRSRKKRKSRESFDREQEMPGPRARKVKDIEERCSDMDERLVRLEKHVTSKRFQLEQELSRL